MKKYLTISWLLCLLFLPSSLFSHGDDVRCYSLEELIDLAKQENLQLRAREKDVGIAGHKLEEAQANFFPVVEYQYRIAPVPKDMDRAFDKFFEGQVTLYNSFRFVIGIPLTTFGKIKTVEEMASFGIDASRLRVAKEEKDVVFQVKSLYSGVLLAEEIKKLLGDAIGKINDKIKDSEESEEPNISPIDLIKLKMFRINLEKRLMEAEEQKKLAEEGLKIQAGLSEDVVLRLKDSKLRLVSSERLLSHEDALNRTKNENPEAQMLEVGVEVKRKQYQLEKFKLMPDAGFAFYTEVGRTVHSIANLTATDDFSNPFNYTRAGVGIQLSGKLDFHGAIARIKHAKAEYFRMSLESMAAKRGLALRFEKAYQRFLRAKGDVGRADKVQSLATQMLYLSKMNQDIGISDNEDYQEALQAVLLTKGEYYKSVFDHNIALADLEKEMGI